MLRVLVLAGNVQQYYAWLREHKIGWVEAVYVNDPVRVRGCDHKIPLIKTGTWWEQSTDTIEAADKYLKIYEEKNHGEEPFFGLPFRPSRTIKVTGVDIPAAAIPVQAPAQQSDNRASAGGSNQAAVAA